MRILGIDYGEKRVGLAISDESQVLAREFGILSPKEFFEQIRHVVDEHHISEIVLGWPLNMSGQETKKTEEVKRFKQKLEKIIIIPIQTIDERLSSVMARKLPGGREDTDSLAAQILLQNYLDKIKNQ